MNHHNIIINNVNKTCPITLTELDDANNIIILKSYSRLINQKEYSKLLLKNYNVQKEATYITHATAYNLEELYKYVETYKRNPINNDYLDNYNINYINHKRNNHGYHYFEECERFINVNRQVTEKLLIVGEYLIRYSSISCDEFCIINDDLIPSCQYYAISIRTETDMRHYLIKHDFMSGFYFVKRNNILHYNTPNEILNYLLKIENITVYNI